MLWLSQNEKLRSRAGAQDAFTSSEKTGPQTHFDNYLYTCIGKIVFFSTYLKAIILKRFREISYETEILRNTHATN